MKVNTDKLPSLNIGENWPTNSTTSVKYSMTCSKPQWWAKNCDKGHGSWKKWPTSSRMEVRTGHWRHFGREGSSGRGLVRKWQSYWFVLTIAVLCNRSVAGWYRWMCVTVKCLAWNWSFLKAAKARCLIGSHQHSTDRNTRDYVNANYKQYTRSGILPDLINNYWNVSQICRRVLD